MARRHSELEPDQALRAVLEALTTYTMEQRQTTFAALMTAVVGYGRSCARAERARVFDELGDARRQAARLAPAAELEGQDGFAIEFAWER